MNFIRFASRVEAGQKLARELVNRNYEKPVVLALPRGGVPVAYEVARVLRAPLGILLVRKIGVPSQPELAAGAVVDGKTPEIVFNDEVMRLTGLNKAEVEELSKSELALIETRRERYLEGRPPVDIANHTVIVVDDGIATGTTVKAALHALKRRQPARTILAVPVAPDHSLAALRGEADEIICLATPEPFFAIGMFYKDFSQVSDEQVVELLSAASRLHSGSETTPAADRLS
jgi:putative phosphoribosyl transferase